MNNTATFLKEFIMISHFETIIYIAILIGLFFLMYYFKKKEIKGSIRILIGTGFGILLGLSIQFFSHFSDNPMKIPYIVETTKWYGLFGYGFISLIKMLIIPLIFFSIINIIIKINAHTNLKKLTKLTLATTLGMVAVASTVGFIVGKVAGLGLSSKLLSSGESKIREVKDITTILRNLIPSNPIKAMVDLNIIAVVIFAILIAIAFRYIYNKDNSQGQTFKKFVEDVHKIISRLALMIIKLMPYAVIPLLANTLAMRGLKSIKDVLLFIGLLYLAVLIQFILQGIFLAINGLSPFVYFKKAIAPLVFAFSSRSSAATLPLSISTLTNKLGVNSSSANFVASFSSTAGMQGCSGIYPTLLIVYLANANGIQVDFALFLMTVIVVSLSSVGIAGIPGTAITAASVSVSGVGFSSLFSQVNPILSIDPILDMGRTCLNVSGGMVNAIVVDRHLKTLDKKAYYSKNNQEFPENIQEQSSQLKEETASPSIPPISVPTFELDGYNTQENSENKENKNNKDNSFLDMNQTCDI